MILWYLSVMYKVCLYDNTDGFYFSGVFLCKGIKVKQ